VSLFETSSENKVETDRGHGAFTQTAGELYVTEGRFGGLTQPLRIYSFSLKRKGKREWFLLTYGIAMRDLYLGAWIVL
jgi:hypothetical protein